MSIQTLPPEQDTVARWDSRATAYDALCHRWPLFAEMADQLLHCIPHSATSIVDLAGGSGMVCERLLTLRPQARLTLMEPSTQMRQCAHRNLGGQVTIINAVASDTGPITAPVDAVVCSAAMHLLDEATVFQAVSTILRPGGTFAFNLWWHSYDETADRVLDPWWETVLAEEVHLAGFALPEPQPNTPRRRRTAAGLETCAALHGFTVAAIDKLEYQTSAELFVDFWDMNPKWLSHLGDQKQGAIARLRVRCGAPGVTIPVVRVVMHKKR